MVIRLGLSRASLHGLRNRGPVRLYLELMLLFGSYFDVDPQYPWAGEVLADQDAHDQMHRAARLYDRTMEYRRAVAGPDDVHSFRALRKIARLADDELQPLQGDLADVIWRRVVDVYPEKAAFVGAKAMQALIRDGLAAARQYDFSGERATTLIVVLMLAFGHGCADDPLYPWIGRTLRDPAIASPEARARRLEAKALTWLRQVLDHFDTADGT